MLFKGLNFGTLDASWHAVRRHELCDGRGAVVSCGAIFGSRLCGCTEASPEKKNTDLFESR
jgi:hypothetical protein